MLKEMQLDPEGIVEMLKHLRENGGLEDLNSILVAPFTQQYASQRQTRFSDGTTRVFYGATELETARKEIRFHCAHYATSGSKENRSIFYAEFSCSFDGSTIDTRLHLSSLPQLIQDRSDGGYDSCNKIGREAITLNIDGLLTPSARNLPDGTCLPVFSGHAISNPVDEGMCEFAYDASVNEFQIIPH